MLPTWKRAESSRSHSIDTQQDYYTMVWFWSASKKENFRMTNIVDEVIKSKCRKHGSCYLCKKMKTVPFMIPERKEIETLYHISQSMEIFKMIKVFWLCEEHFNIIKENHENYGESDKFDQMLEANYDVNFLDRVEQLCMEIQNGDCNVLRYIRLLRKEMQT